MPSRRRSIDPPATATLPFISDESRRTHQTQRTNSSSSIAAGKSKFSFSVFKISAVMLLLVMVLLQNFRALLFPHHQHLQNDDRYKEELMDLPILEDESSSPSNKLGNSLEDIDTANKAADPIHHSTADEDVSVEEDDQKQKDVSVEEDAKKDGVTAAHIQVSPKDNNNIIVTGKDDSSVKTEESKKEEGIVPIGCKCVDCDEDNICGGLWRGNRYQGMLSDEEAIQRKLHIVVSHCKASVSWLSSYIQKFTNVASIHVISKCGATVEGVPENTKTVVIQNVGREGHTFAHYITSILPKLSSPYDNSTVLFLKDTIDLIHQGSYFRRTDLKTLVRVASSKNGFACGLFSEDGGLSSYHDTIALSQFTMKNYVKGERDYKTADGVPFGSPYKNAGELYKSLNAPSLPQVVQVCYGGIFAASTANVFKQDMKVWQAIEAALKRGDNIQEGHYVERLWGPLLSSPLESFQIEALRNYSTVLRSFPFNGQLGRGNVSPATLQNKWGYPCRKTPEDQGGKEGAENFCGYCQWQNSDFDCFTRVAFLKNTYHITELEAMQGLLEDSKCVLPDNYMEKFNKGKLDGTEEWCGYCRLDAHTCETKLNMYTASGEKTKLTVKREILENGHCKKQHLCDANSS